MAENTKRPLKNLLTLLLSLAFAAVFMWLALKGLDFEKISDSLAKANYFWVAVAVVFGVMGYWFRAVRWNILLEPMGYNISTANSFWTISFGYLMNLTIPRSGEVARATALYGVEKVPVDKSFGTIILERIVDLLCMMVFLGLTLVFKYEAIVSFYQHSDIHVNPYLVGGILALGILAVVLFFMFRNRLRSVAFLAKIIDFIDGIFDGLGVVFKMREKGRFILYTALIWISYYLAAYLVCFALPETSSFTFADGFFIIVVGTLGMVVPASGGIGAFHFALKLGISALYLSMGKDPAEGAAVGLSYAFISHTMQLMIMLVMGLISIPMLAKARAEKVKAEQSQS